MFGKKRRDKKILSCLRIKPKPVSKKKKKKIVFWFGVILLLIFLIVADILAFMKTSETESFIGCGDGTISDQCSSDKPYFCLNKILVERPSLCGCPDGFEMDSDSCISSYHQGEKRIVLNYTFNGDENKISFIVYQGFVNYTSELPRSISYPSGEEPSRKDFKLMKIEEENQTKMIIPLVKKIQNLAPSDKVEQARIAVSIVQNIPWGWSGETSKFNGNEINSSRYPYEVLYDMEGVCGEKSELLVLLLREIGYDVAIFYYPEENHEAVGIRCPIEESLGGSGYCFIETSGPAIITDSSIEYSGGIVLNSNPEIFKFGGDISLPENIKEYEDAEKMEEINEDLRSNGAINLISKIKLEDLRKKYGLAESYNLS